MAKSGNKELATVLKEWQGLENDIISLIEGLFNKTENEFVKTIMSIIRHDSEKRKVMLQFTLAHMTKEAPRELILHGDNCERNLLAKVGNV
jgi:hypothetical protein